MEKMDMKETAGRVGEEIRANADTLGDLTAAWLATPQQGLIDKALHKMISRKLIVFITATALMWYGLNPETWGMIAMCYIGGQSAIDMVNAWKWGK